MSMSGGTNDLGPSLTGHQAFPRNNFICQVTRAGGVCKWSELGLSLSYLKEQFGHLILGFEDSRKKSNMGTLEVKFLPIFPPVIQ